jgi:UPF0042 nucleotide-binding protein
MEQKFINLESFGYKFQSVESGDNITVFDVRRRVFDPFRIALNKTGLDLEVVEIVMNKGGEIKTREIIRFIETKLLEGIQHLDIRIGCIGGKHRSVVIVEKVAQQIRKNYHDQIKLTVIHRDIDK